jgi:LacI family transcriptional regulator
MDVPRIALLVAMTYRYSREVGRGVRLYARTHGPLDLDCHLLHQGRPMREQFEGVDGVIAFLPHESHEDELLEMPVPVINVSGLPKSSRFIRVLPDNLAAGREAARFLITRGFRKLACVHHGSGPLFSALRLQGVRAEAKAQGVTPLELRWSQGPEKTVQRLKRLGSQAAVVCVNDGTAARLIKACRQQDIDVPQDLVVMGIENDEDVCELSDVPISSVEIAGRRVGWRAAELMVGMIAGEKPPRKPVQVAPAGVVERASTQAYPVDDPALATALRLMRQRACSAISVEQVSEMAQISRRTLERGCRRFLGRSPHEEIRRVQLERACKLLQQSNLKIGYIAREAGFRDLPYFQRVFKSAFGIPPRQWRAERSAPVDNL